MYVRLQPLTTIDTPQPLPQRCPEAVSRGHVFMKTALTDRALKALKPAPAGERVVLWDAVLSGFGVRVTDRGVISFHVMRRLPGKPQPVRVVLGQYPALSLAEARKKAGVALDDLASGIHPRERTHALRAAEDRRKAVTVSHVVEEFTARHLSRKRTGHAVGQLLRRLLVSRWGDRPITDITRGDVIAMIEAIGDYSPSTARQVWLYTTRLFSWALNRDYGLTASPCDRVRLADLIVLPKARERVLDPGELRAIWQVTEAGEYPYDPFVRLLILLGCRRGELAGMRRDELDLAAGLWQLSGDRTKNEQPRTIPLPKQAVAILASLPASPGPYVFSTASGTRPISGFMKFEAAARPAPWGSHFGELDPSRYPQDHADPSVRAADQRHRRRADDRPQAARHSRRLRSLCLSGRAAIRFELWAARLRDIVEPPPENVVVLREAGQ